MIRKAAGTLFILMIPLYGSGQISGALGELIFQDTLSRDTLHPWITFENPEANIWQLGTPAKTLFDSAHTGCRAFITDSSNNYAPGLDDWFQIEIPKDELFWGEGILSFYHKFDTDTLTDGGVIEVSYDLGSSWKNVCDDTMHLNTNFIGLYEDTIKGGMYGYSGRSDGWQYVELFWHWIALVKKTTGFADSYFFRFRFISDDQDSGKEGWMIDDLVFRGYDLVGSSAPPSGESITVYPNPAKGMVYFEGPGLGGDEIKVLVFNGSGVLVKSVFLLNRQLDISDLCPGIYYYRCSPREQGSFYGKLIIN